MREGQRVEIHPTGGCDGEGGAAGGGYLRILPPEQICTVHCDQAHYVPISGGGETPRCKGVQLMVVSRGPVLHYD